MAGSFYDNRDSVDISELAALNDDISDDFIDQLQQQLSAKFPDTTPKFPVNENDDTTLFEESATEEPEVNEEAETEADDNKEPENKQEPETKPEENTTVPETVEETESPQAEAPEIAKTDTSNTEEDKTSQESPKKEKLEVKQSFDDNFIKKYKAKLQKKAKGKDTEDSSAAENEERRSIDAVDTAQKAGTDGTPIESLSQGNITERPLTEELKGYNDSLDFLDGNVKYSKYVIYIDPENVDFIDKLTVKERKNLINGILRQQNDITITKQRFKVIQAVIRHIIILILTIAISIPVIYHVINASLEATINNHRNAQTNWQTLYREHGKITRH